jgi:hypothetical protein
MRWIVVLAGLAGGAWQVSKQPAVTRIIDSVKSSITTASPADGDPALLAGRDTIRVASFNIQVFGESKVAKPAVMNTLARVARMFDVMAIQEVRAKSNDILPRFVDQINAEPSARNNTPSSTTRRRSKSIANRCTRSAIPTTCSNASRSWPRSAPVDRPMPRPLPLHWSISTPSPITPSRSATRWPT